LCNTPCASARRARFVVLTHRARASLTPSSALSCGTDSFCSSPTSSSAASAQPADVDVLALEAGGCMSSVLAGDRRISIAFVEVCAAVTVRSAQVVRVRTCSCQKIYDMGSSHMTCIMSTACVPSLFRIESCTMFAHACCGLRGSGAAQAIQWHTSDTPPRWTTRSSKLPACGNTAPHHSQKQQQYKSTECKPHCHEPGNRPPNQSTQKLLYLAAPLPQLAAPHMCQGARHHSASQARSMAATGSQAAAAAAGRWCRLRLGPAPLRRLVQCRPGAREKTWTRPARAGPLWVLHAGSLHSPPMETSRQRHAAWQCARQARAG